MPGIIVYGHLKDWDFFHCRSGDRDNDVFRRFWRPYIEVIKAVVREHVLSIDVEYVWQIWAESEGSALITKRGTCRESRITFIRYLI